MSRIFVILITLGTALAVSAQSARWLDEYRAGRQVQLMDGDNDGLISRDEYVDTATALFTFADVNGDGELNQFDDSEWRVQQGRLDADGDGRIGSKESAFALFQSMDADQDGILSRGEFAAVPPSDAWFLLSSLPPLRSAEPDEDISLKAYKKSAKKQFDMLDFDEDEMLSHREILYPPRTFRGPSGGARGPKSGKRRGDRPQRR